jgi:hypothetical protein
VTVTPEVADAIQRAAYELDVLRKNLHLQWDMQVKGGYRSASYETCTLGCCRASRPLVEELRALLPQPSLTCPNCGHEDEEHGPNLCNHGGANRWCECPFGREALSQVRALRAAQADATPATYEPAAADRGDHLHLWQHTVCGQVRGFLPTVSPTADTCCMACGDPEGWRQLFTEVLPGGAS